MKILRLPVGQMNANCYLAWSEKLREAIIVDPGDDADYIISTIQREGLVPKAIFATHGHFDHIMAVLELKLAFGIPFYMHKEDEFLLDKNEDSAIRFIGFDPGPPPDVDFYLDDKSVIEVCDTALKIIHTPGHTPGSVCIFIDDKYLFVGDLIFSDGYVGRTDFSYSDKAGLLGSIEKIKKLTGEITVYSGHGEEFSLHKNSSQ